MSKGELMSKKRMMSKQQRLYNDYNKKQKTERELAEYAKTEHEQRDTIPFGLSQTFRSSQMT